LDIEDFTLFDKALKLNWVKRLCSNSDAPWQYIPKLLLSLANVGGTELFKSNYDYNLLDLDKHLPAFYKQIIVYWQDIATTTPKSKNEVLSQPIWNNRFLVELQRARRASEEPWVRKIGNPSSRENLVMTLAYDRASEPASQRTSVQTRGEGEGRLEIFLTVTHTGN